MAITSPPPPPNSGNPAQFNERADAFLGWFPTFVSDFNADLPLLRGRTYATRAGTANAIALTTGGVTLALGMQVRWRAAAANTGAVTINVDGQGAIEARTVTGAVLPAGYIRTDVDTVATYDGTRWIVERANQVGSNANGSFIRFEDGTQICTHTVTLEHIGNSYAVRTGWLFPAAFVAVPTMTIMPRFETAVGYGATPETRDQWGAVGALNTGALSSFVDLYRSFGAPTVGSTARIDAMVSATGRWY